MYLNGPSAEAGAPGADQPLPVEGLPVQRRPEWTDVVLDGNGYRATLFVLGDSILVSRPEGYVTVEAVENATALSARIIEEVFGPGRPYVHIHDYSGLTGASLRARKRFIDEMKSRTRTRCLIFCGVSPFFRIGIQLAKRLHDFRYDLQIASDFRKAVRLAQSLVSNTAELRPEMPTPAAGTLTDEEAYSPVVRKYAEDVLRYLENLHWEKAGLDTTPDVNPDHPFLPVFEAINLVKGELDDLFEEHRMVENALRKTQSDLWDRIADLKNQLEDAKGKIRDLESSRPLSSPGRTDSHEKR